MADLSDITAMMAQKVADIIYPDGVSAGSVVGSAVKIFEGWPTPETLDLDMLGQVRIDGEIRDVGTGPICSVSIHPDPEAAGAVFQILNNPYVVNPPVHTLVPVLTGNTVSVSGTPSPGEYVTVILDGRGAYSRVGASVGDILQALLQDMQEQYPSSHIDGSGNLVIPAAGTIVVRTGAPCQMAQVSHRQKVMIRVTVWAPDPKRRSQIASLVDAALKSDLVVTLPDTSQALIVYLSTSQMDDHQTVAVYRRDLVYSVEYATLDTFTSYEVTAVVSTMDVGAVSPESTPSQSTNAM